MSKYSKAIAAMVVAAAGLFLGDTVLEEIDVEVLEGAILVILTTAGVFAAPANK